MCPTAPPSSVYCRQPTSGYFRGSKAAGSLKLGHGPAELLINEEICKQSRARSLFSSQPLTHFGGGPERRRARVFRP